MSLSEKQPTGARTGEDREELFSLYSHLVGAVLALAGTVVLLSMNPSWPMAAVSSIYGLSMVFMFGSSALYHATKDRENGKSFLRRLDHLAIFFMIAGSYTPFCYVCLGGAWRWSILGVQWGFVVVGVLLKMFYIQAPRWLTVTIYVAMGWVAVVPFHKLYGVLDATTLWFIVAGGLTYTLGAVIYGVKRPNPLPGLVGFHEVFHLMVVVGAALHYVAVYRVVV